MDKVKHVKEAIIKSCKENVKKKRKVSKIDTHVSTS